MELLPTSVQNIVFGMCTLSEMLLPMLHVTYTNPIPFYLKGFIFKHYSRTSLIGHLWDLRDDELLK